MMMMVMMMLHHYIRLREREREREGGGGEDGLEGCHSIGKVVQHEFLSGIGYNPLILMYNFGLRASIDVSIHHDWLYATSTM